MENLVMRLSKLFLLCVLFVPVLSIAHGPARVKVVESIEVNAPADKVWAIVSDYCSIKDWHPNISECVATDGSNPDSVREITLANGEKIKEKLFKHVPEKMLMQYALVAEEGRIIKGLPIATHGAKLSVTSNDNGSTVEFKGAFYRAFPGQSPPPELSDEACKKAVIELYTAGLQNIKQLAE